MLRELRWTLLIGTPLSVGFVLLDRTVAMPFALGYGMFLLMVGVVVIASAELAQSEEGRNGH